MKKLTCKSLLKINDFQKDVLIQNREGVYLDHLSQRNTQEKERKKVYCSGCVFYKLEKSDENKHHGCKKIKYEWDNGIHHYSINGYCEEINENNDCKEYIQKTESRRTGFFQRIFG